MNSISRITLALLLTMSVLLGSASSCRSPGGRDRPETTMPTDEAFDKVDWGSGDENECTPQVDEDFRGFRIAAPRRVVIGPSRRERGTGAPGRLLICGVYQVDGLFLRRYGAPPEEGTLIATSVETHQVYSASMNPHTEAPMRTPPNIPDLPSDEVVAKRVGKGYFNENALMYLNLPMETGTYDLHVTLGPTTSNVVRVKVELEK